MRWQRTGGSLPPVGDRQAVLSSCPAGVQGSEGFGRDRLKCSFSLSTVGFGFSLHTGRREC